MRVLHILWRLDNAGTERQLVELLRRSPGEHEILTLSGVRSSHPALLSMLRTSGIAVHAPELPWRGLPLEPIRRADILHGWLYYGALGALLLGQIWRKPCIWSLRQELKAIGVERGRTRLALAACARFSDRPAAVLYNSREAARDHQNVGFDPERSTVIPNLRLLPEKTARPKNGPPVVGMLARFHPVKDQGTFLRAADTIGRVNPHVRFVLAGKGCDSRNAELAKLLRELSLDDKVELAGEVADPAAFLRGLDLLCSCSLSEASSNSLWEGLATGVFCVHTGAGDAEELIGPCGWQFEKHNHRQLAGLILSYLQLPESERSVMREQCIERAKLLENTNSVPAQYHELYRAAGKAASGRILACAG